MLIRNGHRDIMLYRIGFFNLAIEEIGDYLSEHFKTSALAHRVSQAEEKEWNEIMVDKDDEPKTFKVDHSAQMKKSARIDNA